MKKQLNQVLDFHKKFHALVNEKPSNIPEDRINLRYSIMKEEIEEYLAGANSGNKENITKELCDILYGVYGTIIEHGLQDKIEQAFDEVHRSNMSKDYSPGKMIKGEKYSPADLSKVIK